MPMKSPREMSRFRNGRAWSGIAAVCISIVLVVAAALLWGWLRPEDPNSRSNSETLRDVGFLIGGVLALAFALWRAWVAERQANASEGQAQAAQSQVEAAQLQVQIAGRGFSNERYQRAAQMISDGTLYVRLAGIYTLQELAIEDPSQYHIRIMNLFGSFLRASSPARLGSSDSSGGNPAIPEDIQAVIAAIGGRSAESLVVEQEAGFSPNLSGVDLSGARLSGLNLFGVDLSRSKFHGANFLEIRFSPPDLSQPIPSGPDQPEARTMVSERIPPDLAGVEDRRANLSLAILTEADLSGAFINGADLSGAQLVNANLVKSTIIYANLRSAILLNADLSGSQMFTTNFAGANLGMANLEKAELHQVKLYGANFFGASLKQADFSGALLSKENGKFRATGLTQTQLNEVIIDPDAPPDLTGVIEAGSRKQLIWKS